MKVIVCSIDGKPEDVVVANDDEGIPHMVTQIKKFMYHDRVDVVEATGYDDLIDYLVSEALPD